MGDALQVSNVKFDDLAGTPSPTAAAPKAAAGGDSPYEALFDKYATAEVPRHVLRTLAKIESDFNPSAMGSPTKSGRALGMMQIMPANAAKLGINPLDPDQAVKGAAAMLNDIAKRKGITDPAQLYTMYTGSEDPKQWGPKTQAAVTRFQKELDRVSQQAPAAPKATGELQTSNVRFEDLGKKKSFAGDVAPLMASGTASGIAGPIVELGNILTAGLLDKAVSSVLGTTATQTVKDAAEYWLSKVSPETKASMVKTYLSDKPGEILGEGLKDPRKIATDVAMNLPQLLATIIPGYGAAKVVAGRELIRQTAAGVVHLPGVEAAALNAASKVGAVTEGALGAGAQGSQTRDEIMNMPEAKLMATDFAREMKDKGYSTDKIREMAANRGAALSAAVAGPIDALLGAVGSRYLGKLAGGGTTRPRAAALGVVSEGGTETLQGGAEQASTNVAVKKYGDESRDLLQDVGENMVASGVVGSIIGGGAGAVLGGHGDTPIASPKPTPSTPPVGYQPPAAPGSQPLGTAAAQPAAGAPAAPAPEAGTSAPASQPNAPAPAAPAGLTPYMENGQPVPGVFTDAQGNLVENPPAAEGAAPQQPADGGEPRSAPSDLGSAMNTAYTPGGIKVESHWAVVPAASVDISHDLTGAKNPDFPQELQARDLGTATAIGWMTSKAADFKPELLGDSGDAGSGAPIVGPDANPKTGNFIAETGRKRMLLIRKVYADHPEAAAKYMHFVQQEAAKHGIDPGSFAGIDDPVLVRVRQTPMNKEQLVQFSQDADAPERMAFSRKEQALVDAGKLTPDVMATYDPSEDGDIFSASNRAFMNRFMTDIVGAEQASKYEANKGELINRVKAAMFAKAFPQSDFIDYALGSEDQSIKQILNALNYASNSLIEMRQADVPADLDFTQHLIAAASIIKQAKENGQDARELISQVDLIEGKRHWLIDHLAEVMASQRPGTFKAMGEYFKTIADFITKELWASKSADIFSGKEKSVTLDDVIKAVNKELGVKNVEPKQSEIGTTEKRPDRKPQAAKSEQASGQPVHSEKTERDRKPRSSEGGTSASENTAEATGSGNAAQSVKADDVFAANRAVLKNFKPGDRVQFHQPGTYTQDDGSKQEGRTVTGVVDKIQDKDQGTVHVFDDGGGDWSVNAAKLEKLPPSAAPKSEIKTPLKGDRFTDDSGNKFEVWSTRHDHIEAFPVINGKMIVNSASSEFWALTPAAQARYPDARTDYNPTPREKKPVTPQIVPPRAAKTDAEKAAEDVLAALDDLAGLMGGRKSIMPIPDEKLIPVLTRLMDAAFRLGYHKFKEAAKYVLDTIRAKFGNDVADAITIDHLQGSYIAMAGKYQGRGADRAVDVVGTTSIAEAVKVARAATDTNPTPEQAAAGNYQKGKIPFHGLTITLENPKGSVRSGTDANGKPWSVKMPHDYGYFNRTDGADGEQVDAFIGPKPESNMVYVVDQNNADGTFDEHKVMAGFPDEISARKGYLDSYTIDMNKRVRSVTPMTIDQFKEWLKNEDQTKPTAAVDTSGPDVSGKLRADGAGGRPGIVTASERLIPEPGHYVGAESYSGALDPGQRLGVNLALTRFAGGGHGFLLADGTGVGKTRELLAIADQMKDMAGKPVMIVTQNKQIIAGSFTADAAAMGINLGRFELGTYDDLRAGKIGKGKYGAVLYDEAHNLKNIISAKTIAAYNVKSDHILYATATPLDRPVGAAYFMSQITGETQDQVAEKLGFHFELIEDKDTGEMKPYATLNPKMTWQRVMDNMVKLRDASIAGGAMIRREYPFYGEIRKTEFALDEQQLAVQNGIEAYWQDQIENSTSMSWRRTAAGLRIMELSKWLESQKVDYLFDRIKQALADGRQIVVVGEYINPARMRAFENGVRYEDANDAPKWPMLIGSLEAKLKDAGIDFAKIYGPEGKGHIKGDEVAKFQSGAVGVALATPKSGGTGINLDDVVGNRPRTMLIATPNFAGDVFDQLIGRVSRRNTRSEAIVEFVNSSQGTGDIERNQILVKKIQAMRAVQHGEDLDLAYGVEVEEKPQTGAEWAAQKDGDRAAQGHTYTTELPIIEHTTRAGKVIRGVVAPLSYAEANAIDDRTFRKDTGHFIREVYVRRPGEAATQELQDLARSPKGTSIPRAARSLVRQWQDGKMTSDRVAMELAALFDRVEHEKAGIGYKALVRGEDAVREKILNAKRRGKISHYHADFMTWLLNQNPEIAGELNLSIREGTDESPAGQYLPEFRVARIFTNGTTEDTGVHELLHHTERMLPAAVRKGIREEWLRRYMRALKDAEHLPNQDRFNALKMVAEAMMGSPAAQIYVKTAFQNGILDREADYQLTNPSEFWAVNATDILGRRYAAESWIARAKLWLMEFVERAKGAFGLTSRAPIIRGLNSVINGERDENAPMLYEGQLSDLAKKRGVFDAYGIAGDRVQGYATRKASDVWDVFVRPANMLHGEYRRMQAASLNEVREIFHNNQLEFRIHKPARVRTDQSNMFEPFDVPVYGTIEKFAEKVIQLFQDRMRRLFRIERTIKDSGGRWSPEASPYRKEELYHGIAADKLDDLQHDFGDPIIKIMGENGITMPEADLYLYARHAPERNAYIQEIDPENPSGSGMSDEESAKILQGFADPENPDAKTWDATKLAALEQVAQVVDRLNDERLNVMVAKGLIDEETRLRLKNTYQKYVPLRGKDDDTEEFAGTGRGFSMSGKELKKSYGRFSRAKDILAYTMSQAQVAVIRGEKNEVGLAFLKLVEANPNPQLWEVNKIDWRPYIDRDTGEVAWTQDRFRKMPDDKISVKVNGKEQVIAVHDEDLARSMKQFGVSSPAWVRGFSAITQYIAIVNTALTPEFVVSNLTRDAQTAIINIAGERGSALMGSMVKDAPAAMKGMWELLRHKGPIPADASEWMQHASEFSSAGGRVSFLGLQNVEQTRMKLLDQLKDASADPKRKAWMAIRGLGKFIMDVNGAVENGMRLSLFVNARKTGFSIEDSASMAKNVTVNFNRRGEMGAAINAFYAFFNASVQGTARLAQALISSPRVRYLALGIAAFAASMDWLNRDLAGEDTDGKNRWDKVPDYVKERNLVIMKADGSGDYYKIPMPYGYNIFWVAGQALNAMVSGHEKPGQTASRIFSVVMSAFNPLSSSGSGLLQTISPSLLDPFVQQQLNENFFGGKIKPDQPAFGPPKPESELFWHQTPSIYIDAAREINELSGGNQIRPGLVSISPNIMQHYIRSFFGGAGEFWSRTVTGIVSVARGEDVAKKEIPFVRRLYGTPNVDADASKQFYQNVNEIKLAHNEFLFYAEQKDPEMLAQVRQAHMVEIGMYGWANSLNTTITQLRSAIRHIRNNPNLPEDDKVAREKQLADKITSIMSEFNRQYEKRVQPETL